jgi:hypothetical protein
LIDHNNYQGEQTVNLTGKAKGFDFKPSGKTAYL